MNADSTTALTVVLVTPDRYDRLRPTIACLRQQTVRDRIEVVIVAPRRAELDLDEGELAEFAQFRVVETGTITSTGEPRAAGARAARSPITVFGEDHSWPEPGWGEALIEAFKDGRIGVGPTLTNGNGDSTVSWASFLLNFGPCIDQQSSASRGYIPTHNSAYKTEFLKSYGERLGSALEVEGLLQGAILSAGGELFLEAKARTAHINISVFRSFVREQYWGARFFWASRARWERWSLGRRGAWAAATPALVPLRLLRAFQHAFRVAFPLRRWPRLLFDLTSGVFCIAGGAFCGIVFGGGATAGPARLGMEFHRARYLRGEDRHLLPDD